MLDWAMKLSFRESVDSKAHLEQTHKSPVAPLMAIGGLIRPELAVPIRLSRSPPLRPRPAASWATQCLHCHSRVRILAPIVTAACCCFCSRLVLGWLLVGLCHARQGCGLCRKCLWRCVLPMGPSAPADDPPHPDGSWRVPCHAHAAPVGWPSHSVCHWGRCIAPV